MTEQTQPTFVLYQKGQAVIVSQEEWERSWLKWWQRLNSDRKNRENK